MYPTTKRTLLGDVGLRFLAQVVPYHGTVVIDGERYTITSIKPTVEAIIREDARLAVAEAVDRAAVRDFNAIDTP